MTRMQVFLGCAAALATAALTPVANATTVQVIGAGSSALFNTASLGAYNLAGSGALHYTTKGSCTSGNCAQLFDSRQAGILPEGGNLAVVWSADQSKVWAYLSVDSVVGNRAFFAVPRAKLQLDAQTESGNSQQLISSALWGDDQTALPASIYNALNNTSITAAFTDIRPEDAKSANTRVLSPLDTTDYSGLGYNNPGNPNVGIPIVSSFSTAQANPVNFSISGNDPITNSPVPISTTISVGASPVIIVVNRSNASGLGFPGLNNTSPTQLRAVFEGTVCNSKELTGNTSAPNVPLAVILREPLSGTMNTFEYTNIRLKNFPNASQEFGVDPSQPNNNPLNLACTAGGAGMGVRRRAIGTGEVIKNGLLLPDSVGYAFFSYGNVSPIANNPSYGYLTLNSVDPIAKTYSNGQLPGCTAPCAATPGSTFPNLRNGSYRSWSVLRGVTDGQSVNPTNYANLSALISEMQNTVNSTVPDFVPFNPVGTDPGLRLYRSHYFQAGVAPNNGLSGQKESGGDVGGCIEKKGPAPGVLNCHQ